MCGCNELNNSELAILETLQGRQKVDYGYGAKLAKAGNNFPKGHYQGNPSYSRHDGHLNFTYGNATPMPLPLFGESGYAGNLPISQQPRIDKPLPYTYDTEG